MIHEIGTKVKVNRVINESDSFHASFVGAHGTTISYDTTSCFYDVKFDNNTVPKGHPLYIKDAFTVEQFLYEELEVVNEQSNPHPN